MSNKRDIGGHHAAPPPSADPAHAPGKHHIALDDVSVSRKMSASQRASRNTHVTPKGNARRGRGGG